MRDVPDDILTAAYALVPPLGLPPNRIDVVALTIAQAVMGERDRAVGHIDKARDAIRNAGDGSAERVSREAIQIIDEAATAIRAGAA